MTVAISAANTRDSHALKPLINAIPAIRPRRKPRRGKPTKLHTDKTCDIPALRAWLRQREIIPRIACKAIESNDKLGRHRWVIEPPWLTGQRRLTIRYERKPSHYLAFLTLAAAITCDKNSPNETTSKMGHALTFEVSRASRSILGFPSVRRKASS